MAKETMLHFLDEQLTKKMSDYEVAIDWDNRNHTIELVFLLFAENKEQWLIDDATGVGSEEEVIEFEDTIVNTKKINCLRCDVPMILSGNYKFHEGTKFGLFGNLLEAFVNRESFDLYICPECGKVEFFSPQGLQNFSEQE